MTSRPAELLLDPEVNTEDEDEEDKELLDEVEEDEERPIPETEFIFAKSTPWARTVPVDEPAFSPLMLPLALFSNIPLMKFYH